MEEEDWNVAIGLGKKKDEEGKDNTVGHISGSVKRGDVTLSAHLIHNFDEKKSKGRAGLRTDDVGEVGVDYDGTKKENRIEFYYRLPKPWDFVFSLLFGAVVSGGTLAVVPEPYNIPAALISGPVSAYLLKRKLDSLHFSL